MTKDPSWQGVSVRRTWSRQVGSLAPTVRRRPHVALRVLACLMPVLMAWAVVATGNHYVLDVVAGIVIVAIGHLASLALESRRVARG